MNRQLRTVHRDFDVTVSALVRAARRATTVPCGPGCDACCYDVAWVLEAEARELAERVRSMPRAKRASVILGVTEWYDGMRRAGLDVEDNRPDVSRYARARLPCPLLDRRERRCTVYDVRPLSCRGHYVIAPDASPCASRALVPHVKTIVVDHLMVAAIVALYPNLPTIRSLSEALLPHALARALANLGVTDA